jgi:hypothetical protein
MPSFKMHGGFQGDTNAPSFDGVFQGQSRGLGAAGDANGASTADLLRAHV